MLNKYLQSYSLFIALVVILSVLLFELVLLGGLNSNADKLVKRMDISLASLRIDELSEKLRQIDSLVEYYDIKVFSKELADKWVLESVQDFKDHFSANISDSSTDEKGMLTYKIKFSLKPKDPSEIVKMMNYLENSIAPVINITKVNFNRDEYRSMVDFEAVVVQPFKAEEYSYE